MFGFKKAPPSRVEPTLTEPLGVGNDIAEFLDQCLEPKADSFVTLMDVWERYLRWCHRQNLVPIAYPLFTEEFHDLAVVIFNDIKLIEHRGAHIFYKETAVIPERA